MICQKGPATWPFAGGIGINHRFPSSTYKLVGDITYLFVEKGWLYLSCCVRTEHLHGGGLDRCWTEVGADSVLDTLQVAQCRGYVAENAAFHSDKGAQYIS